MSLELVPTCERILEVGYGVGLFLPALRRRAGKVDGVDIHGRGHLVMEMLNSLGATGITLHEGSVLDLPFADGNYDAVVCISVLEHIKQIDKAVGEVARVTKPGGSVILGIPTKNRITRRLFWLVGYDDEEIHPSSHDDILRAARQNLRPVRSFRFPPLSPLGLSLYSTWLFVKPH